MVTDGVLDPWDPQLHEKPESWTFDYELAVEAPIHQLEDSSDKGIAESWMPLVLWALTDWLVTERVDVKGMLGKFRSLTLASPQVEGLERFLAPSGFMGVLVGIPFVGGRVGAEAVLTSLEGEDATWLLTAKPLLPDEYAYAVGVEGGERGVQLAEAFLKRGDRHHTWPSRPSIMPDLGMPSTKIQAEKKWWPVRWLMD